ncbi:hypothetical protein P4O66_002677 [Electrophorus voltai]|uniref:CCHC-type domain-containing protein n=1 Tax=Electrophorus voltai TaxID=2609070 RepID=A0AAD9DPR1_9TELE|nr:hypothetical protein P4O66_002677 [Electrophorus voltai]
MEAEGSLGPGTRGIASAETAAERVTPVEPGMEPGLGLLNTARFRWRCKDEGIPFLERIPFIREILLGLLQFSVEDLICVQRNGAQRFFDVSVASEELYGQMLEKRTVMGNHPEGVHFVVEPLWRVKRTIVTIHVFNPYVTTGSIRRFIQQYGEIHSEEKQVRDELGVWNGRRQYLVLLKEDGKGGWIHPPAYFSIDGSKGYLFYPDQPLCCRNCRGQGHKKEDCPGLRCHRCLERGHLARVCKGPQRCRRCQGEGHLAQSCPGVVRSYAMVATLGGKGVVTSTPKRGAGKEKEIRLSPVVPVMKEAKLGERRRAAVGDLGDAVFRIPPPQVGVAPGPEMQVRPKMEKAPAEAPKQGLKRRIDEGAQGEVKKKVTSLEGQAPTSLPSQSNTTDEVVCLGTLDSSFFEETTDPSIDRQASAVDRGLRGKLITTHMFNPHVLTDQIRRFLQGYGEVHPGECYVRDELGIWNGRRQFMVTFKEDGEGGLLHPPTLFVLGSNRRYLFYRDQPAFCRSCRHHGHKIEDCPELKCLNCLDPGHMARDCRGPRRCRVCRGEGHLARSYPRQGRTYAATVVGSRKGEPASPPERVPAEVLEPEKGDEGQKVVVEEVQAMGQDGAWTSNHTPPPLRSGSPSSGQSHDKEVAPAGALASSRKRARAGSSTPGEVGPVAKERRATLTEEAAPSAPQASSTPRGEVTPSILCMGTIIGAGELDSGWLRGEGGGLTSVEEKNSRYSHSSTLTLSKALWENGEEFGFWVLWMPSQQQTTAMIADTKLQTNHYGAPPPAQTSRTPGQTGSLYQAKLAEDLFHQAKLAEDLIQQPKLAEHLLHQPLHSSLGLCIPRAAS